MVTSFVGWLCVSFSSLVSLLGLTSVVAGIQAQTAREIFQLKKIVQTRAYKAMKRSNCITMIGAMKHPATQPSKYKGGAKKCKKELKASCKKELKASCKKELKASCTKELTASCNQSYHVAEKVQSSNWKPLHVWQNIATF